MLAEAPAAGWVEVLDELERGIGAAMSGDVPTWTTPPGLGPLPASLEDRARLIFEAQGEAARMIADSQKETLRHLQAVESVPDGPKYPPRYGLDVIG